MCLLLSNVFFFLLQYFVDCFEAKFFRILIFLRRPQLCDKTNTKQDVGCNIISVIMKWLFKKSLNLQNLNPQISKATKIGLLPKLVLHYKPAHL